MNDGRLPFCASPSRVNCEMASSAPFVSRTDRFILPAASSKMRSSQTLAESHSASATVSPCPTPRRTQRPGPIWPTTFPSTATLASLTRCTTARIGSRASSVDAALLRPLARLPGIERLEQGSHVVGVLLLLLEDLLHQAAGGRIVVAEVADHVEVRLDGDALGDEVFLDHVDEGVSPGVLGVAPRQQAFGVEVGRPAELTDPFRDPVRVLLLLDGVLHELVGDGLVVDPRGHVMVPAVAPGADDLRGPRLDEELDRRLHLALVGGGHRAFFHVLAGPPPDLLDVAEN